MSLIFSAIGWLVARLPDRVIARLARLLFVRTERELERATSDVEGAQRERLLSTLRTNADTEFGRAHGFAGINDVDAFRANVPLGDWDAMAADVDRMVAGERGVRVADEVFYFATTSGTTGRRKLIPVTPGFVEECRVASKVLFRTTLTAMPGIVRGKRLTMRSPHVEKLSPRAEAGSITLALSGGITGEENRLDAVPADVYRVKDFRSRYFLCLRFAAEERVAMASAINPSTLHLFAKTLEEHAAALATALDEGALAPADFGLDTAPVDAASLARRLHRRPDAADRIRASVDAHGRARMCDLFPDLAGLACWKGGSAPWYLARLPESYGSLPILDYGYAASEGCFGAPLSTEGAASVLLPHGHFFEFIPEDRLDAVRAGEGTTLLLHELEVGKRYDVVVTTGAGLYRYDMNDIIEVVGHHRQAPLVVFRHKAGAMSSITGEKLAESQVVHAMERAARESGVHVGGFAVAPLLPENEREEPRYLLAIDVGAALDDASLERLGRAFDVALGAENEEYAAKRESLRLGPVAVTRLPDGALAAHRARRVAGGAPDAHVKIPHLSGDGALLIDLGLERSSPELAGQLPCRVRVEAA